MKFVKLTEVLVLLGAVAKDLAFLHAAPASSYTLFPTESRRHFTVIKTAVARAVVLPLIRTNEAVKTIEAEWTEV